MVHSSWNFCSISFFDSQLFKPELILRKQADKEMYEWKTSQTKQLVPFCAMNQLLELMKEGTTA